MVISANNDTIYRAVLLTFRILLDPAGLLAEFGAQKLDSLESERMRKLHAAMKGSGSEEDIRELEEAALSPDVVRMLREQVLVDCDDEKTEFYSRLLVGIARHKIPVELQPNLLGTLADLTVHEVKLALHVFHWIPYRGVFEPIEGKDPVFERKKYMRRLEQSRDPSTKRMIQTLIRHGLFNPMTSDDPPWAAIPFYVFCSLLTGAGQIRRLKKNGLPFVYALESHNNP